MLEGAVVVGRIVIAEETAFSLPISDDTVREEERGKHSYILNHVPSRRNLRSTNYRSRVEIKPSSDTVTFPLVPKHSRTDFNLKFSSLYYTRIYGLH